MMSVWKCHLHLSMANFVFRLHRGTLYVGVAYCRSVMIVSPAKTAKVSDGGAIWVEDSGGSTRRGTCWNWWRLINVHLFMYVLVLQTAMFC